MLLRDTVNCRLVCGLTSTIKLSPLKHTSAKHGTSYGRFLPVSPNIFWDSIDLEARRPVLLLPVGDESLNQSLTFNPTTLTTMFLVAIVAYYMPRANSTNHYLIGRYTISMSTPMFGAQRTSASPGHQDRQGPGQ